MLDHFEPGKSYRWIGPQKPIEWGISDIADHQWRKKRPHTCLSIKDNKVDFKGIKNGEWPWAYEGFIHNFEEAL